ncbi:Transmembrane protein 45B [Schistosoma japonicum]|nr:Transmembrane protein 45B [Schistosoma japonicum]
MYIFSLGLSWWILAIRQCYNTIKCNNNNNNNNVRHTTDISPSFCYHRHRCLEGSCKILFCSIGIIIELYCLTLHHHHHHHHHDYAYTQLPFYISFIIAGLLDILISTIISPPKGIDYVIHALPFYIHSYCFRGHSYEQSSITLTCYLLISYWGFITGISIINEMLLPKYYQVIPDWTRSIQQNTSWQKYQSNSMPIHNNNNI